MNTTKVRTVKNYTINVISVNDHRNAISDNDAVMDERAVQAVKSAIAKAKLCHKPIAKYDIDTKKVYIEYANGGRKYIL